MDNPNTNISNQKKLRILVAEDNEINQQLIQRILQKAGYVVDMVDNGREAVEFASRNQYDFILMDIQMPIMEGHEAARRIRNAECRVRNKIEKDTDAGDRRPETSGRRPVPIIALTGGDIETEMEKCLGLGMNGCIGKPLFRDQLLSVIKIWTAAEPVGPAAGKAQKDVATPVVKNSSAHQPIDLDRALNEFMGEKEVLNGILNEFTRKVRSQINAIQRAILSLDFNEIAKEAHSIKGGAANLTANMVAGIASALEKAAELKQVELAKNLAGELEEKLQQLETYLQNANISVIGA